MPKKDDPLDLAEFEPEVIEAASEQTKASKSKIKPPNELDLMKEKRLLQREERLKRETAPPPTPGPSVEPVDPSPLLDRIHAYKQRFPHLKSRNKVTAKTSIEEIEDEIHFLETQLGAGNDGKLVHHLYLGVMNGLEVCTRDYFNPLQLNLQGLGAVAKDNMSQVADVLDELSIKYSCGMSLCAEYRLALSICMMVVTVHSANSGDARIGEALRKMHSVAQPPPGSHTM
jgi:hypothetical protein